MTFKNKTIQKLTAVLIILSIFTPTIFLASIPKKAEAQWVVFDPAHTAVTIKIVIQEIVKQFLMVVARRMLDKVTQSTIKWINTGHYDNPFYVENPKSFFKDIAKSEIRDVVRIFGYNSLRFPFGKDFALNTINSYQRQLEDNTEYSLSKVINDPILLEGYRNDFNVGGWNGFLVNTQYPQNNYLGFRMLATEELARRLAGTTQNAAQKVQTTLQQGLGFLSPQTCPSNPRYNNGKNEFNRPTFDPSESVTWDPRPPSQSEILNAPTGGMGPTEYSEEYNKYLSEYKNAYDHAVGDAKAVWEYENICPKGLVATTPGSVVANQIIGAMGSKGRQNELAAAMGNSLAAIFDALISRFFNAGLKGLSNAVGLSDDPGDRGSFVDPLTGLTIGDVNDSGNRGGGNNGPNPFTPEGGGSIIPGQPGWCSTAPGQGPFGEETPGIVYSCPDMWEGVPTTEAPGDTTPPNDNDPAGTYDPLTNPYFDPYASPTGTALSSLESAVAAERAKYPASFTSLCTNGSGLEPTSCPLGYILNAVAWNNKSAGWGVSRKTGGHRCSSPAGEIACDILIHQPTNTWVDVFVASETNANPTWDIIPQNNDPGRAWVAPAQP